MSGAVGKAFDGNERFRVLSELGAGGMGSVYEVFDDRRDERVALKTLTTVGGVARFKREFRALAGVSHPNLVNLHELFFDDRHWFFTMDRIEGVSLLEWLCPSARSAIGPSHSFFRALPTLGEDELVGEIGGVEDARAALPLAPMGADESLLRSALGQLVDGVAALHSMGLLHCDLKPTNVLVTKTGRVVILDFGLVTAHARSQASSDVSGTPAYMAPEQAVGEALGPAADWYAVGAMLYQALAGRVPFEGPVRAIIAAKLTRDPTPIRELVRDPPEDLEQLAMALLARDPRKRPSEAAIRTAIGLGSEECRIPRVESSSHFVGRERELDLLEATFSEVVGGARRVVHLHGNSGVGKSELGARFVERLREDGRALVLSSRCHEHESLPYKAVDHLIDELAEHLRGLPEAKCEAIVAGGSAPLEHVFPALATVSAWRKPPTEGWGREEPGRIRRQAFAALRELLGRLAREQPLVLHIDDLQWGDLDSAALLAEVVRRPDPPPLLLLASYRIEDVEGSSLLTLLRSADGLGVEPDGTLDLPLSPFSREECVELARSLLADDPLEERAAEIGNAAEGSPYLVSELVHHARSGGGAHLSLEAMLTRRIEALPAPSRRHIELVAAAGGRVEESLLAQVVGDPGLTFRTLVSLRQEGLIRRSAGAERGVEAYHARTLTAVREGAGDRMTAHHLALAKALEGGGTEDAERLARHFAAAGEPQRAFPHALRAARAAERALAFDRAAEHYRSLLRWRPDDGADPSDLVLGLARALAAAGRGIEAAEAFVRASSLTGDEESLRSELAAAEQYLISGEVDEGLRLLTKVLKAVGLSVPRGKLRTVALFVSGRAQLRLRGYGFEVQSEESLSPAALVRIDAGWVASTGLSMADHMLGAAFQTHHVRAALDAGEPSRALRALSMEAAFVATKGHSTRGRAEDLVARVGRSAAAFTESGGRGGELRAVMADAAVNIFGGRWQVALPKLDAAAELARREPGAAWELDTTRIFAVEAISYLGRLDELARRVHELIAEARERGNLYLEATLRTLGHVAWLAVDDPDGAEQSVHDALARWSSRKFQVPHGHGLHARAQILLYRGRGAEALAELDRSWSKMASVMLLELESIRLRMHYVRGTAAVAAAGEAGSPRRRLLRRAASDLRRLRRERAEWARPLAELLEACLIAARSSRGQAIAPLEAARVGFEECGMDLHAAVCRYALASIEGADLREASAVIEALGGRAPQKLARMLAPGLEHRTV